MATVAAIITDALLEIGAIGITDASTPTAADLAFGLTRFQQQLDAWQAERLTLSLQRTIPIVWPAATSVQTIGPSGANVTATRPLWIEAVNYVVPGSSPGVEVGLAPLSADAYAALAIKALRSALPQSFFYQVPIDQTWGTLFLWPQPTQPLTVTVYTMKGVDVPVTTTDTVIGPPGYAEAFMYQLALRLCTPYSRPVPPLLPQLAATAFARMQRPNVDPGLLGADPALTSQHPGGYNILSDSASAPSVR